MKRVWIGVAGLSGAVAVAADAAARHILAGDTVRIDLTTTAARYGLVHAVALVALAGFVRTEATSGEQWFLRGAGWCFVAGILFFCGSLYLRAAGAPPIVSVATPVGGTSFILGWTAVLIAALRLRSAG